MATIKFSKLASRVRIQLQDPTVYGMKDLQSLKEEVKFLKNILHLKSSGGGMSEIIYKLRHLERENKELREQRSNKVEMSQILRENYRLKTEMKQMLIGDSLQDLKRPATNGEDSHQSIISKKAEDSPAQQDKAQPASAGLLPSIHKPKPNKSLSSLNSHDAKDPTEEASEHLDSFPQIHASHSRLMRQPIDSTASRVFPETSEQDFLTKMKQTHTSSPKKKVNRSHLYLAGHVSDSPFNNSSHSSRHKDPHLSHHRLANQHTLTSSHQQLRVRPQQSSLQTSSTPQRAASKYSSFKRHHELVTIAAINTDKLEKLQHIHRLFESLEKRPGVASLASFKPVFKHRSTPSRFDSQLSSVKQEMARIHFN